MQHTTLACSDASGTHVHAAMAHEYVKQLSVCEQTPCAQVNMPNWICCKILSSHTCNCGKENLEAVKLAAGYPCKHAWVSNPFPGPVQPQHLLIRHILRLILYLESCSEIELRSLACLPVLIRIAFCRYHRVYKAGLRFVSGCRGFRWPCRGNVITTGASQPAGKLQQG